MSFVSYVLGSLGIEALKEWENPEHLSAAKESASYNEWMTGG